MNDNRTLLTAFHFRISFRGLQKPTDADTRFQSVSGLKVTAGITDTDSPSNKKKIPPTLFNPVVLRRAIDVSINSPLRTWILESLNKPNRDSLQEVLIEVLDEEHKPQLLFRLKNVTAAGWELGELNAQKSDLLMEEITLQYDAIELVK